MPQPENISNNNLDSSNPYYLGSSDNPGSILVSNVFNGIGFTSWKRSMTIALTAKNKYGFVDGSIVQPLVTSEDYLSWCRVNSMVTSWILNSLEKNIADSVLFMQSAAEIWKELNHRYAQSDGALIYQIQQQLYSTSQNSDDFSTYFTKLSKIWDELKAVQELPNCSCGATVQLAKYLENQRVIQLLMGLHDSYKAIRAQILMMKPLPSVSTVYSIIVQEERQREISISPTSVLGTEAIAMQASSSDLKKSLICNHCKKPGHTKSQCYRLHGFPANFKFTKSVQSKRGDHQSSAQSVVSNSSSISQEQLQQLIHLLNVNSSNASSSASHVNSIITDGAMENEGPFIKE